MQPSDIWQSPCYWQSQRWIIFWSFLTKIQCDHAFLSHFQGKIGPHKTKFWFRYLGSSSILLLTYFFGHLFLRARDRRLHYGGQVGSTDLFQQFCFEKAHTILITNCSQQSSRWGMEDNLLGLTKRRRLENLLVQHLTVLFSNYYSSA